MSTSDSKRAKHQSNSSAQNNLESRPLPKIPQEQATGFNSKELEKNRYAYFMSEVQKWKNEKPSPKHGSQSTMSPVRPPPRQLPDVSAQQDQSISWNLENDMSLSNRLHSNAKQQQRSSHAKEPESRFGFHDLDGNDPEGDRSNRSFDGSSSYTNKKGEVSSVGAQARRGVVPVGVKTHQSQHDERNIFKDSAVDSGTLQGSGSSSHGGNITYHNAETTESPNTPPPRRSESQSSTSPKHIQTSNGPAQGSLIVPANLANLTENQIDQLRDVRNALALISTQKSRVEQLKKERTILKEEVKKAYNIAKKLRDEMAIKSTQQTQALQRVSILEKEKQSLLAELQELRKKSLDESLVSQLREEIKTYQTENESLKQKVSGLQVDQKVLEKILKEMVFEKQREGVETMVEAGYESMNRLATNAGVSLESAEKRGQTQRELIQALLLESPQPAGDFSLKYEEGMQLQQSGYDYDPHLHQFQSRLNS